jgi:4-amino-4-deoxy-L-arabinose transferase-like glycosyltransferase
MAFGLHTWRLDGKGLWLPEAIHAAAAQATPMAIIQNGWLSGAVERTAWLLLLGVWQPSVGSSEFALRFLSVLGATAVIPILWQMLKSIWPNQITLRLFASLLMVLAPSLHFYAQDISIYSLLAMLATLSLYLTVTLCRNPSYLRLLLWLAVAWLLTLSHPFSATLVIIEAVMLATLLFGNDNRKVGRVQIGIILILALVPWLAWALASPGTQPALATATTILDPDDWSRSIRMEELWKDLTFGNALWQSYRSRLSVVLLPIFACGAVVLLLWRRIPDWCSCGQSGCNRLAAACISDTADALRSICCPHCRQQHCFSRCRR